MATVSLSAEALLKYEYNLCEHFSLFLSSVSILVSVYILALQQFFMVLKFVECV